LANIGGFGGQEVPHFHVHLFGGQALSQKMVSPR
jgi:diadenosine tetraphosphate (Ap4A) HIT family hydrolase